MTAGIDFALSLVANVVGEPITQTIQLLIEYKPAPPFECGSPQQAPAATTAQVEALFKPQLDSLHALLDAHPPQARA